MMYIEHVCLKKVLIAKELNPVSYDGGKTWLVEEEYGYRITYCPYCGVEL